MTIAELHSNEELRHDEFPVTRAHAYFAHAGVSPLPRRVAEAMAHYALNGTLCDQEEAVPRSIIEDTRAAAARLLNAQPGEIALVGPTSLGLSFIASGLEFRRGANILIYHDDYPSNVYPWMHLAERGVEVRLMNIRELGKIRDLDVLGQADENTKLVALASCHFISGWRLDLQAIGQALRRRRILFCVDGIQTLGAFPTTVEHIDLLAADAHKWLLGPCASGLLYVRQPVQEELRPTVFGWHNVRCPDFVAQEQIRFRSDARRYEAGSANLLGIVGLKAALELLLEVGIEAIAAELLRKRAWLVPALQAKGLAVLQGNPPPENAGAIISFYRPGGDMAALHGKVTAAGIVTSLRTDRRGQHYLRVSPHFYNTDAELQRLVDLL
ncbi:MAG: aminotransferase class V-fold PLP-dependent enzyme [Verrucomicrobia bacterium]|nr:aminotransferase class V-fold PLP-dependent enzyme [Verrucomicrobiota bacterium]